MAKGKIELDSVLKHPLIPRLSPKETQIRGLWNQAILESFEQPIDLKILYKKTSTAKENFDFTLGIVKKILKILKENLDNGKVLCKYSDLPICIINFASDTLGIVETLIDLNLKKETPDREKAINVAKLTAALASLVTVMLVTFIGLKVSQEIIGLYTAVIGLGAGVFNMHKLVNKYQNLRKKIEKESELENTLSSGSESSSNTRNRSLLELERVWLEHQISLQPTHQALKLRLDAVQHQLQLTTQKQQDDGVYQASLKKFNRKKETFEAIKAAYLKKLAELSDLSETQQDTSLCSKEITRLHRELVNCHKDLYDIRSPMSLLQKDEAKTVFNICHRSVKLATTLCKLVLVLGAILAMTALIASFVVPPALPWVLFGISTASFIISGLYEKHHLKSDQKNIKNHSTLIRDGLALTLFREEPKETQHKKSLISDQAVGEETDTRLPHAVYVAAAA